MAKPRNSFDWTDAVLNRLRELWANGVSTGKIALDLKVSKNAVVGKAHRLNLPARPSPIRRCEGGAPREPKPRRLAAFSLPPLAVAAHVPHAAPEPILRPVSTIKAKPCCWPLGELRTPSFRFCSGDSIPGKPYCEEHHAIAFVRAKPALENALAIGGQLYAFRK